MSAHNIEVAQSWAGTHFPNQQPRLQLDEEYPYIINHDRSQSTHRLTPQPNTSQSFSASFSPSQYSPYGSDQFSSPPPPNALPSANRQQSSGQTFRGSLPNSEAGGVLNDRLNPLGVVDLPQNGLSAGQQQQSTLQNGFNQAQFSYRSPFQPSPNRPSPSSSGGGSASLHDGERSVSYPTSVPMQFSYPHPPPRRQSEIQQQYIRQLHPGDSIQASMMHQSKRHRGLDESDSHYDAANDDGDGYQEPNKEGAQRPKGTGACARCKGLKVKCEFKTEHDPCRRCLGAGQECIIPGRKKRRTPPKREHLLNQIREQAAQIQKLMNQLEAINSSQKASASVSCISPTSPNSLDAQPHTPASTADLHSEVDTGAATSDITTRPEVQDWIAKARQSIEAFGGIIGTAGTGATQGWLSQEDAEVDTSDEDEYEIGVENSEGEEIGYATEEDNRGLLATARDTPSISSPTTKKKELGRTLPIEAPFGLMADLSLKKSTRKSVEPASPENAVGVANVDFFKPSRGPGPIRQNSLGTNQQLPDILNLGIISTGGAEMLFKIYFENMNMSTSLLDPILYTPQYTAMRSPFLFTVICAVASRYNSEQPELYNEIMRYAQLAAGTALISGPKNEELCAGYLLLQLYPVHSRRWEEDRSWIFLGLAIRIAQDLNLNRSSNTKSLNELHSRVLLNRTRIWLNCFNLDRSSGSQYGRLPIIKNTDFVANNSGNWWQSEYNLPHFDMHLCCYNAELRVIADFMAQINSDPTLPAGTNKNIDYEKLASETEDKLVSLQELWFKRLEQTDQKNVQNTFRTGLLRLAFSYARLVALSYGFQHAFGGSRTGENPFFMRCFRAASDVVHVVLDDICRPEQRIYVRHGPDAQSIFVTFACAFLVKLLQPKYTSYLTFEQRVDIRTLVQRAVDMLGSPEIAVDERHAPKLYSRFLQGLLATPMARLEHPPIPNDLKVPTSLPRRRSNRRHHTKSSAGPSTEADPFSELSGSVSSYGSPSAMSQSQSPSPTHPEAQFNQLTAPMDVQQQSSTSNMPLLFDQGQNSTFINNNDFFVPPMPFDSELLESMQTMADPVWQDTTVPGFNWMSQMQSGSDLNMSYNDYTMFDAQYASSAYQ